VNGYKFDDSWAISQLQETLQLAGAAEPDQMVAERLAQLAPVFPLRSIACLRLMIDGDQEGWGLPTWREHARTILRTAIQSTDEEAKQAAEDLVHRLGAMGHLEYRDLVS